MKKVKILKMYHLIYGLAGIVFLIAFLNVFSISSISSAVDEKIAVAKELAKPALIELAIIVDNECENCFDVSALIEDVKRKNVDITAEESFSISSDKYDGLIKTHGIEKLPAIIITGEINKISLSNFNKKENALVFEASIPPYTNAITNQVKGLVDSMIIQDSTCEQCADLNLLVAQLKQSGVVISSEKTFEADSTEGKELTEKYGVKKLPALILSPDAKEYNKINEAWPQIGSVEDDGWFVMREISPPYVNLENNEIAGLIKLIFVTDTSCTECYDVNIHKQILSRFGLVISEDVEVDVSSEGGKKLVEDYDLIAVPTVIIQGDTEEYPALAQVWSQVGTIENDGGYVFRRIEAMGQGIKYKDLETNSMVDSALQG